ncbi:M56 family metallopeptidase [Salinimicrobium xinjiangense]|uniref:M56 family metallopeptidase n=1 Tax=Salinimicrobium xinjiangense TaxID=438596 RepID=UPI000425DF3F|nr:M56 family metallopeptidase [Salinimicrobium xinjiangense]
MLHYILQIIVFQLAFLLVYELLLKKETFFTANRIYLLLTPLLAMLLPLLKLEFLQQAIPAESLVMLPEVFIGGSSEVQTGITSNPVAPEASQSIEWWLLVYGAGFLFSLGMFFNKYMVLKRLFSHKPVLQNREMKIVEVPQSKIACTFYNTIFLGSQLSEKEREQILSHEIVHVKQKHTLDLLFFEILKIVFWFNPLVYIYQNRISALHEFLADAGVVKNVKKQDYFQQLLNSAFNTEDISFINQFFNHSIIKKRIVMLQKNKSRSISKFKFLIILPLMLAMLTYVSCSDDPVVSESEKEATAQEKLEEIKAIVNSGAEITADDKEKIKEILSTISVKEFEEGFKEEDAKRRKAQALKKALSGNGDVPFAVIDEVPVFPGCEALKTNEDRKGCMSEKINAFVSTNFDTSLGQQLGLEGINRVYVQFKIAEDGTVEVLGARAPHPVLEEEARRVVNLLPQMKPGKQSGQEVGVLYSLPITFRVGE